MKNENALLTTAILSYVYLENKMDNIDLLSPFIKYIIGQKYNIGDTIDCDYVISEMEIKYAFKKLPLAILQKVLTKMCKEKIKILKKENGVYSLIKDLKEEVISFESKELYAKKNIDCFITDLREYLLEKKIINNKYSNHSVEQAIMQFLEKNGFIIMRNPNNIYKWDNEETILNYNICKYLINNYENKTEQFQYFMRMVEGFMLSNVMYMQFENDINKKLDKVEVYIDAPLILRILGLKKSEDNRMANELLSLLKKQRAIIRCFEHNYKEVETIIESYKIRKFCYGSSQNKRNEQITYEQTLEYFDEEDYSESDIELFLMNLRNRITELGIHIVECPNVVQNAYYNLDMKKMTKKIQSEYKKKAKNTTIYNDVLSINAINIIRKGAKFPTIEKSKAIFVTLNYALENSVSKYLNLNNFNGVSLCINDVHLTSLLWVKNNTEADNLTKAKVLSSILAGFDLPNNMIEKVKNTLARIEKYSSTDIDEIMNKIITSKTGKALMEITGGDINKISENSILDALSEDKNKEIDKYKDKINKAEKEIKILEQKDLNREKEKNNLVENLTTKIKRVINIILWLSYIIITLALTFYLIYIIITNSSIQSNKKIIKYTIYFLSFLGYFPVITLVYKIFSKVKSYILNNIELKVYRFIEKNLKQL